MAAALPGASTAVTTFTSSSGVPVVAAGFVVDGSAARVIEIAPYEQARTPLGGCMGFHGTYITDPTEIAGIRRRIERSWSYRFARLLGGAR